MTQTTPRRNGMAIVGLCLGILSVFTSSVGIIPILAVIFSAIGLSRASKAEGKGRILSWIGLILGVVFTLVYVLGHSAVGPRLLH